MRVGMSPGWFVGGRNVKAAFFRYFAKWPISRNVSCKTEKQNHHFTTQSEITLHVLQRGQRDVEETGGRCEDRRLER